MKKKNIVPKNAGLAARIWENQPPLLPGQVCMFWMSDGYVSYRRYAKRLRCLAHLLRKARGLSKSLNPEAQAFGEKTLVYMAEFIKGIYRAREGPGILPKEEFAEQLADLKEWCEQHRDSTHE